MTTVLPVIIALAPGACAMAPTMPGVTVLPGSRKSVEQFRADTAACQQQAQSVLTDEAQAANNQAVANVAVGTLVGAAAGALLGQGSSNPSTVAGWGAGTGLLIGSSVGVGNSQVASYTMQQRFDAIYVQCMYRHGHKVPGQVSYRRPIPAAVPDFPPPNQPPPNQPPPGYPAPH